MADLIFAHYIPYQLKGDYCDERVRGRGRPSGEAHTGGVTCAYCVEDGSFGLAIIAFQFISLAVFLGDMSAIAVRLILLRGSLALHCEVQWPRPMMRLLSGGGARETHPCSRGR